MKKTKLFAGVLAIAGMLAMSGCGGDVPVDVDVNVDDVNAEVNVDVDADDVSAEVNDIVADEDLTVDDTDTPPMAISENEEYAYLYEQYYDIISDLDPKWDKFAFIDVTVEGFPSVLITSSEMDPALDLQDYMLLTYSNAGAYLNEEGLRDGVASAGGYRGNLYYVPYTGIIYEDACYAPYGNPCNKIYLLDNGQLFEYADGYTEVLEGYEGPEDTEHLQYFWNVEEVSAEQYEENVKNETNNYAGIEFYGLDYLDKATIMGHLEAVK
jgi:hypothetical protein